MAENHLSTTWLNKLFDLREQGMQVTDINPVSALVDIIGEQLEAGEVTAGEIRSFLDHYAADLWEQQVNNLRWQTGLGDEQMPELPDFSANNITRTRYRAVFTAHPVFAMRPEVSAVMCAHADNGTGTPPDDAFAPRQTVTLADEHQEALVALKHARAAVNSINADILRQRRVTDKAGWRNTLPQVVGVSTWVG